MLLVNILMELPTSKKHVALLLGLQRSFNLLICPTENVLPQVLRIILSLKSILTNKSRSRHDENDLKDRLEVTGRRL